MPTVKRITDPQLRRISPRGRAEVFDRSLSGFGARATPDGRWAFFVRYRRDGRQRRISLGTYGVVSLADARDRARLILADVARGLDPAEAARARRRAPTFRELAAEYMERHAKPHKRSWRYDQQQLDLHLLPDWGGLKAREIDRLDVLRVLDAIVARGHAQQASRVRALASKVFAFGVQRGLVEINPVRDVPRPAPPRSRDRVLSTDELRRVWRALDAESPHMAATFRLRLLTAQRGIEVLSMRWEDVDGDGWTIPAGVSKNKRAHRVPLSPQALAVLETIRPPEGGDVLPSPWVFPAPNDDGHMRWVQKAAANVRRRSGVAFVPHDLRRTAATYMGSMGCDRTTLAAILNHADPSVTAIYDRSTRDLEKRRALSRWGSRLEAIVEGAPRLELRMEGRR
jgi:integrase